MPHETTIIHLKSLTQPIVFTDNGKPGWPKVWHLLAVPAIAGLFVGLIF